MDNNIVMNKIAEHAYDTSKCAGIKRVERMVTSLVKKRVGGKKSLKHILDNSGPFANADLAREAAKRPNAWADNKGLVKALHRSGAKLERRISRFGGGDDEYTNKLFTQFRGYGHLDSIGRRLIKLSQ